VGVGSWEFGGQIIDLAAFLCVLNVLWPVASSGVALVENSY